ncbi:hypothetical protein GCK72_024819 [Caenorhabditis remanei]|uniref:RING-type domain-containing protein n=2 Tax=Caenorhabditis remanei TaxID=31234 RepID=E3LCL9_CAERE|nr:hypothetical protein GCK72_024819 [Caenorhabditis remanei]EFO82143.1 hypothetical protein CRE_00046 [Caenorhabditis remanei]KAF1748352.1 hypothetical protein GCK72_024819 [Caenorhabditis remanei]
MSDNSSNPQEEPEDDTAQEPEEDNDDDYCTACLDFLVERKNPPSCTHGYCIRCFYLLISRRDNCLICNCAVYDIDRVFKDLRSQVNIEANKTPYNRNGGQ